MINESDDTDTRFRLNDTDTPNSYGAMCTLRREARGHISVVIDFRHSALRTRLTTI